jgi:hypothetical protein
MFARILTTTKTRAGLAVLMFGWIVMAIAIGTPAIQAGITQLSLLVAGFGLLIGGLVIMILTEP